MNDVLSLAQHVVNFLKYKENIDSASVHTLRAYRRDLSQAFDGIEGIQLPEFEANFRHFLPPMQMRWAGLKASSRARKAATLKSFCGYLFEKKLVAQDWGRQIHAPKVPHRLPHFLSVDEVMSVMTVLNRPGATSVEEEGRQEKRLLFLLLYGGGLRVSEACGIKWGDIEFGQRTIRILGKGSKERLVAFPDLVFASLKRLGGGDAEESIWGDPGLSTRRAYEMIRKLGRDTGLLHPIHPHVLRHSFATHLLSGGANLRSLQELLGHSSLVATQRYTQVTLDELARTLQKHHPLGKLD